jgi:hypothetical protein
MSFLRFEVFLCGAKQK